MTTPAKLLPDPFSRADRVFPPYKLHFSFREAASLRRLIFEHNGNTPHNRLWRVVLIDIGGVDKHVVHVDGGRHRLAIEDFEGQLNDRFPIAFRHKCG